jgi:hypothetical protein
MENKMNPNEDSSAIETSTHTPKLVMSARGPYGWPSWRKWLDRCRAAANPEYYAMMRRFCKARKLYNRAYGLTLLEWREWLSYCDKFESRAFYMQEYEKYLLARKWDRIRHPIAPKPPSGFDNYREYLRHLKRKADKGIKGAARKYRKACTRLKEWQDTHKKRLA